MRIAHGFLFCLVMAFATTSVCFAQNNPYQIDDECYKYMTEADKLIGKPGFDEQNEALLKTALLKEDKKAEVLYYVEKLRDNTRRPDAGEQQVLESQARLKEIAERYDYMQYYFQSYQFVKNYYYNNGKRLRALDVLLEMQQLAIAKDNEYGKWLSDGELASIYLNFGAGKAARSNLARLIDIYKNTDNPTIRRQSLCNYYLNYAEAFAVDVDSVEIYVNMAWKAAKIETDSVRCARETAKIQAMKGNRSEYTKYRDICLSSDNINAIGRYTGFLFSCIDEIFDGTFNHDQKEIYTGISINNIRVLSCVAEATGQYRLAGYLKNICLDGKEKELNDLLDMNLSEMEAKYKNNELSATIEEQTSMLKVVHVIVAVLLSVILLGGILSLYIYVRNLRKSQRKDRIMIAELTEANERARAADVAKTQFIQNMTHELRTPLNAISGFSQVLSMTDDMSAQDKKEMAGYIVDNTNIMTMLIDDIINSSAMDRNEYEVVMGDAECGQICRDAMATAEYRLQRGVRMRFKPSMPIPYELKTDARRVQQVLINLLTNACKHTVKGEIRLGCSLTEVPGMLSFSVEDTGPGIPASEAERIFERFVKLDSFVQGTGLGLSICRQIAQSLGGSVYLDTGYNGGARFVFNIPVSGQTEK
ncbi:MAG: sensor histidine kinase [Bacteroidaceae bacterium]